MDNLSREHHKAISARQDQTAVSLDENSQWQQVEMSAFMEITLQSTSGLVLDFAFL